MTLSSRRGQRRRAESDDPLDFVRDYQARFKAPRSPGCRVFAAASRATSATTRYGYIEKNLAADIRNPTRSAFPTSCCCCPNNSPSSTTCPARSISSSMLTRTQCSAITRGHERLAASCWRRCASRSIPAAAAGSAADKRARSSAKPPTWKRSNAPSAYIVAGDIMQVVVSQRMGQPFPAPPLALYRALRSVNPSPYMFYLRSSAISTSSARRRRSWCAGGPADITLRPIAGTRPRGATARTDEPLATELLADPEGSAPST